MKTTYYFFLLLLFSLGCTSETREMNRTNSFYCKIDGKDFDPNAITATNDINSGVVQINAKDNRGTEVRLLVKATIPTGTYSLDVAADPGEGVRANLVRSTNAGEIGASENGTIAITTNDVQNKRLKGSFSFITTKPVGQDLANNVSGGRFDVYY